MEITPGLVGILGVLVLFTFLLFNLPVAFAFGLVGSVGILYFMGPKPAMTVMVAGIWAHCTSYTLMAVPLFVFMGQLVSASGVGPDLYFAASKWVGKIPGGLAVATTCGCAAFAACTGASSSGVLTFAPIAFKPMIDLKYSRGLALGTLCAGATMGLMIPPSISFIIYATITEESVADLFIAGVVPGVMEAVFYSIVIIVLIKLRYWSGPPGASSTWKERFTSLSKVWGALILFMLVIGGIYGGIFTPTEGSAAGAIGALLILITRRGFDWGAIWSALRQSISTSCMVFLIVSTAKIFTHFMAVTGLSASLIGFLTGIPLPPIGVVSVFLLVYAVLGCLVPPTAITLLTVPFLYPVFVETMGFSGLWFGVLIVASVELSSITPPVGGNLFILQGLLREEAPLGELYRGVIPFVIADFVRLALIVAFPAICLFLPSTM